MSTAQSHGLIVGRWPGTVASYDKNSRECRVRVPGLTDGGDVELLAEIEYPVGDKSAAGGNSTDILMLPGDLVWLEFIGGDPRYPIITGQRNPRTGNISDWRRFHQANIELLAQSVMNLIAGGVITVDSSTQVVVKAPNVLVDSPTSKFTGNVSIGGGLSVLGVAAGGGKSKIKGDFEIEGAVAVKGGSMTHNDINIGSDHRHREQGDGADTSGPH